MGNDKINNKVDDTIEMNMLRERAKGIPRVTKKHVEKFHPENLAMRKEFLEVACSGLSKATIKQYTSGLNIYFKWIYDNHDNKPLRKHTRRMWQQYMAWLMANGLSSSALKFKKSSISSMCEYICETVSEDDENYEMFKNFTKSKKQIPSNKVYEKIPLRVDEINKFVDIFLDDKDYLTATYLLASFYSGGRRAEIVQIKVEDILQDPKGKSSVETGTIIAKGQGGGKPINLRLPVLVLDMAKRYLNTRDFESDYLFANKTTGKMETPDWCNRVCTNKITPLAGRRINPHILRASSATFLLESGKDIKVASKHLNHGSIEVTALYDLRSTDNEIEDLFDELGDINIEVEDGEEDE